MMKRNKIILISLALMFIVGSIVAIAQITLTNTTISYSASDLSILKNAGFDNLPYSTIWCDVKNCYYNITRAGADYTRTLDTNDIIKAKTMRDADIQLFMDESLSSIKKAQSQDSSLNQEGKIVVAVK